MAASKNAGLAIAGCNYVGQDQIWKDNVTHEMIAAKRWPDNWQFLTQDYKELVKDDFPPKDRQEHPPSAPLLLPKVIPLKDLVDVYPSTKPVPQTTSAMIGWRSTEAKLKLERYGKYTRPKLGIEKQLNWPIEGIE